MEASLIDTGIVQLAHPSLRAGGDFYDITMRMVLVGFQRFERKFASFPELVATINKVRYTIRCVCYTERKKTPHPRGIRETKPVAQQGTIEGDFQNQDRLKVQA